MHVIRILVTTKPLMTSLSGIMQILNNMGDKKCGTVIFLSYLLDLAKR